MFAEEFERKIKDITTMARPDRDQQREKKKIHRPYENEWIDEALVKSIMTGLKPKRCEGYDRIPLIFYKDGAEELTYIITILMQKVIRDGKIPEQWKVAKVVPIHKKGKRSNVENYRPISNLCSVTKIFERLVLDRINAIEKCEHCDLTGEKQHGFKKNHSTETAGIEIQTTISQRCDDNEYVTVTSLDLTAAFDVIDHRLLIRRLRNIGLPSLLVNIIEDWLSERMFYCAIRSDTSDFRKLTHGTVQGSILGPILFAIFVSPMEDLDVNVVKFADDNYIINSDGVMDTVLAKTQSISAVMSSGL